MPDSDPDIPLVLYVEDDRINAILMEERFRRLPAWRLYCVESGAEAVAAVASLKPVFAMIDMQLPDTSGLALLPQLRALPHGAELPCVALSADDSPEVVRAAQLAGFMDYWLKPVDPARLEQALQLTRR